jgi:hypothetical protein
MKASLVVYDCGKLHKKSELKIETYGYVRGCPKRPATQVRSLEILGVNVPCLDKKDWPLDALIFGDSII